VKVEKRNELLGTVFMGKEKKENGKGRKEKK